MHVAINNSALSTGHRFRGVGSYTQRLIPALKRYEPNITYSVIDQADRIAKDVDLVHNTYLDLYDKPVATSQGYKTVVTIHDVIPLVFPRQFPAGLKGTVYHFFVRRSLNNVSAIITDSCHSKNDIVTYLHIVSEKVHVVPLAAGEEFHIQSVNDNKSHSMKKQHHLPERYLLYVGDVNWNKNLLSLVNALKYTQDQETSLVMVGSALISSDTPETQCLIETIQKLKLNHRIKRIGYVPIKDLVGIYNEAYGYVQPSRYEGFGFPVLEAMACGCPVVTTTVSSLSEIAGDAVIPIEPSEKSIANGIDRLYSLTDSQRRNLVKNGLNQTKKYTWKRVARQTAKVYRMVIKQ